MNYVFQASPGQVRGQTTTLSESIKNFKAKQEADKKQKLKEESEKKANLLELRAGNKQSSRAANAMLKMAKSANKSVIDEATNHRDTSATLAGRNQCDNDDYGYESKASQSVYEKLMAKYESNHEDPMAKFAKPKRPKPLGERDPREKKERDPREKKERKPDPKFQPFRKPGDSKPKTDSSSQKPSTSSDSKKSGSSSSGPSGSSKAIKKVNNKLPPPPSFADLMKMAKNKKGQPQNPVDLKIPKNKEGEFDRPMTTAQKEEFIRERNSQLRKSGKLPPSTSKPPPASSSSKPETKKNSSTSGDARSSSKSPNQSNGQEIKGPCKENNFRQPCLKKGGVPAKRDFHSVESRAFPGEVAVQKPPAAKRSWNEVESRPFPGEAQPKSSKGSNRRDRSPSPLQMQRKKSGSSKSAGNRIESDEEYDSEDSEMDDFIDDTDSKIDVSSEIAKMFGYDRRKYRDDDEDDRSMENNSFSSMMKEEARSAKIGRQEDLEDMRREEEENRRRANRKKQKSSGGGRSRY